MDAPAAVQLEEPPQEDMAGYDAERRRRALRAFLARRGWSARAWALAADVAPSTLTNFLSGLSQSMTDRTWSKLAQAAAAPLDEIRGEQAGPPKPRHPPEVEPTVAPPPPSAHHAERDVPIMGTAAASLGKGAFWMTEGVAIDMAARLPGIRHARHVYALYVCNSSMEPRWYPRDLIYVDPNRPAGIGDFVVVQVKDADHEQPRAYVKRLVRRTADWLVLEQFNPACEIRLKIKTVVSVHYVLTTRDLAGI